MLMLLCLVLHFCYYGEYNYTECSYAEWHYAGCHGQQKDKESTTAIDVYALLMSKWLQWKSTFGVNYRHKRLHETHHNEDSA